MKRVIGDLVPHGSPLRLRSVVEASYCSAIYSLVRQAAGSINADTVSARTGSVKPSTRQRLGYARAYIQPMMSSTRRMGR
jgi:hypothetical protein